jgi:hypothetical protein
LKGGFNLVDKNIIGIELIKEDNKLINEIRNKVYSVFGLTREQIEQVEGQETLKQLSEFKRINNIN